MMVGVVRMGVRLLTVVAVACVGRVVVAGAGVGGIAELAGNGEV